MFRRQESRTPAAPRTPATPGTPAGTAGPRAAADHPQVTRVAPGTVVRGALGGTTEVAIDGRVEGEVKVEALVVVGPGGEVVGPLSGTSVRIAGRVEGRVQATDRVELVASGSVEGDIAAPRIVIAEGAFFKGRVEMRGQGADA
jgi:cytoskeletal protein CcmA (bactofilin family)